MAIDNIRDCKRIMVVGCGGSGKSHLTVLLAKKLGLPPVHLDVFFWQPDWVECPREEWLTTHSGIIENDSWIIDGNYSSTIYERAKRADGIVYLKINRFVCIKNCIARRFKYAFKQRPDMAEDCPEKLRLSFLLWILHFDRDDGHKIRRILRHSEDKYTVVLTSRRKIKRWLADI